MGSGGVGAVGGERVEGAGGQVCGIGHGRRAPLSDTSVHGVAAAAHGVALEEERAAAHVVALEERAAAHGVALEEE